MRFEVFLLDVFVAKAFPQHMFVHRSKPVWHIEQVTALVGCGNRGAFLDHHHPA